MNALKITVAATATLGIAVALLAAIATLLTALGHLPSDSFWQRFATLTAVLPLLFVSVAGLPIAATGQRGWRIAGAVAWGLLLLRWTQLVAPLAGMELARFRDMGLDLGTVASGIELGVASVFVATLAEAAVAIGAWSALRSLPRRVARLAQAGRNPRHPHLPSPRPL